MIKPTKLKTLVEECDELSIQLNNKFIDVIKYLSNKKIPIHNIIVDGHNHHYGSPITSLLTGDDKKDPVKAFKIESQVYFVYNIFWIELVEDEVDDTELNVVIHCSNL